MDKAALLAKRLPEDDVEVPDVGVVRVRGLTRSEVLAAQEIEGTADRECQMLACGMVDPALTVDEARQWQEASPAAEIEPVVTRIAELSGMVETSAKDAIKSPVDES
jgi:hypothetical protein